MGEKYKGSIDAVFFCLPPNKPTQVVGNIPAFPLRQFFQFLSIGFIQTDGDGLVLRVVGSSDHLIQYDIMRTLEQEERKG